MHPACLGLGLAYSRWEGGRQAGPLASPRRSPAGMKWRKFLEESGQNVWTLIRDLIQVAVEDYPDELRLQRDSFAEQLFCLPPHGNACYRDAKHADPGDCKPALFAAAPAPAPPAAAVAQPATGAASRRPHGRQRIYRPGDDDEDDDEPQPQQLQQLEPELRRDGKGGASAAHSGGGDSDEDVMVDRRRGDADEDTGSEGEDKDVHDPVDYETALQLTQDLEDERLRMDQITKIGRKLEDKTMVRTHARPPAACLLAPCLAHSTRHCRMCLPCLVRGDALDSSSALPPLPTAQRRRTQVRQAVSWVLGFCTNQPGCTLMMLHTMHKGRRAGGRASLLACLVQVCGVRLVSRPAMEREQGKKKEHGTIAFACGMNDDNDDCCGRPAAASLTKCVVLPQIG